jgi:hypothetical protein
MRAEEAGTVEIRQAWMGRVTIRRGSEGVEEVATDTRKDEQLRIVSQVRRGLLSTAALFLLNYLLLLLIVFEQTTDLPSLEESSGLALILGTAAAAGVAGSIVAAVTSLRALTSNVKALGGDVERSRLRTHQSAHHLFGERERLLPKKKDVPVELAVDAADLPEGLLPYLELLERNGIEVRVLLLDPDSPLVSRHRFSADEDSDVSRPATESIRAKMRKAIALVREHATVRLYDAMPLGNLVIVEDRIFWGGIPSVPTDVSLPLVEMTADIHGHLYWSYRRNFDRLWDAAKPAEALVQPAAEAIAPGAG